MTVPMGLAAKGGVKAGLGATAGAAAPWWPVEGKTCGIAYRSVNAESQIASYTNLANPGTWNANPLVTPGWTKPAGWVFTGTQYLEISGRTGAQWPADQANFAWLIRFSDWTGAAWTWVWGYNFSSTGIREFSIRCVSGAPYPIEFVSYGKLAYPKTAGGVLGVSGNTAYLNGSPVGTLNSPGNYTPLGGTCLIGGGRFQDGRALGLSTVKVQALAFYENPLTEDEMAAKSALMAAL